MGKSRKSRLRMTGRARSGRKKNATCRTEHFRVIMSSYAIGILMNLAAKHEKTCDNPDFVVDGHFAKLLHVRCKSCGRKFHTRKDSAVHKLSIPDAIAAGALCSGIGYSSMKTLFSSLEIPVIARETYVAAEERIGELLDKAAIEEFRKNADLERQLAIENGDVVKIGDKEYPFITVTVDGGWAKRSYGHSYNSNAGVAVIIGHRTRKIVWMDCRIKTCLICDKASSKEDDQKEDEMDHKCYKNWTLSSQAMESSIIVEGFRRSLPDHGLIYRYVIGDADSSVFSAIQEQVVYPGRLPVVKIDCVNHARRCLNATIHKVHNNTQFSKKDRDTIEPHMNRFGKDFKAAVAYNNQNQRRAEKPTSAMSLAEDIINIPAHVLGDHTNCRSYFCKTLKVISPESIYKGFQYSLAGKELLAAFHRLANRSSRLIYNVTSNSAECFMNVMTKCTAGKRINFAQRGSYQHRANSAMMGYNNGAFWLPFLFPVKEKEKSCKIWDEAWKFFKHANTRKSQKKIKTGPFSTKATQTKPKQKDAQLFYGPKASQGTFSEPERKNAINLLVQSLWKTDSERDSLETLTVGQSKNELWKSERRNRLTASNCGRIFSLQGHTSNLAILKDLLYPRDLSGNENIKYGIDLEPEAKQKYSALNNVEFRECGLFVSSESGILAASPDAVLLDGGILEVKCVTCPPSQIPERADNFLIRKVPTDPSSSLLLKKSHKYYKQIVMQLYVTKAKYCDLFVFHKPKDTPTETEWFQERIWPTNETTLLWNKIREKLIKFYEEEVAPEIVDPIYHITKLFRTSEFRQDAINKHNSKPKKATKPKIKVTETDVIPSSSGAKQ